MLDGKFPAPIRIVLLIFIASNGLGSWLHAADWPTFAHDNQRSGVTDQALPGPLKLQWIYRSPAPPAKGWSLPVNGYGARKNKSNVSFDDAYRVIGVGDMVYFCSSAENRLYALDAATGAIRWSFFTGAAPRLAPSYWKGKLYLGADDGKVYCLNADDGKLIWKFDAALTDEQLLGYGQFSSAWPVRAGVMIEDGIAYFVAGLFPSEGIFFYALSAENGSIIWRKQIDENGNTSPTPQGYPLASKDSVFLTSRTAPTRWSKADGSPIQFATPFPDVNKSHEYRFYNGGTYAQIWNDKNLVYGRACLLGYDPDKVLIDKYKRKVKGELIFNWFNARQVVFKKNLAFLATDYHVLAVEQNKLSDMARNECKEFEELYKGLNIAKRLDQMEKYDRLLKEHGPEHPLVIALKNGPLKWGQGNWDKWPAASKKVFAKFKKKTKWMTPLRATEAMIMAGNVLYLGGEKEVLAIDAASGNTIWNDATESRVRALTAANGRLLVSTIDGAVRCYEAKAASQPRPIELPKTQNADPFPRDKFTSFYKQVADSILAKRKWNKGYCLILGGGDGRLAYELAKRTRLKIKVIDPRASLVDSARIKLASVGLYGARITVETGQLKRLPYSPYLFNLVIDQSAFFGQPSPTPASEVIRVTRPAGGVAYLGQPPRPINGSAPGKTLPAKSLAPNSAALVKLMTELNVKHTRNGNWIELQRGALPGARDWTHNYATAANTYCSEDKLVKGPFGVLWYGEPGPRQRVDRHAAAPIPLVVNGIMFTQGYDLLMAYDIYNGLPYWQRTIAGVTRTSLPLGTSNMVADKDGLFVVVDNKECLRLDAKTGKTLASYPTPPRPNAKTNYWGWIAKQGKLVYGSRSLVDTRRRKADQKHSDEIFAIDIESGKVKWRHTGGKIEHDGIAIWQGKVFLVEQVLNDDEKAQAPKTIPKDSSVPDRQAVDRRGKPIEPDFRKLIALDALTGRVLWQQPFNATDITLDDNVVYKGRVAVAVMVKDGIVVVHGTGSLGHPHREYLKGEFARRALYAFSSDEGKYLWGGRKNYRKRPIIVGDYIYAEPFAWRLKTGKLKTTINPLTGKEQDLNLHRGYIGCSHLLASGSALFGNKVGIGYYNLDSREGFTAFSSLSLGCGLVATPAGGVFVAPEGRSGCTCAAAIHTSIVLYPRDKARAWGISIVGLGQITTTPVKHAFVNLGAPGYREDKLKNLWLPYPAKGGNGLVGKWLPTYKHRKDMFYRQPAELLTITGDRRPWLYTSGYAYNKDLKFTLIDKGQAAAKYTVKLYFAEPDDLSAGERVFTVSLQGKPVLNDFDIAKEAGGPGRAIVKTFTDVQVTGELTIGLRSSESTKGKHPILCAFEAVRQ